jgi:hypothetical protein
MKQAYLEELKAVESEINHMKQDMEERYALRLEDEQVAEGQLDKYNSLSSSADSLFEKIAASTKIVKNAIVSGLNIVLVQSCSGGSVSQKNIQTLVTTI